MRKLILVVTTFALLNSCSTVKEEQRKEKGILCSLYIDKTLPIYRINIQPYKGKIKMDTISAPGCWCICIRH
jgi:hypothetical protein